MGVYDRKSGLVYQLQEEKRLNVRFGVEELGANFTWDVMKPKYDAWNKDIKITKFNEADQVAQHVQQYLGTYAEISKETNVPVTWLAAIHYRESNNNFSTYFGNGDPLNRVTRHVPAGHGPFKTWAAGTMDSLHQMGLVGLAAWTLDFYCYSAERFNGEGYEKHGMPSPYVYGGTSVQVKGKYVADGVFNPYVMDQQLGVIAIYYAMVKISNSLVLPLTA